MAACDPHPQVAQPCADDGVSIGQVLGTRGDISFDEHGETALTAGQTTATVEFLYEKVSVDYVFEYLYVKSPGAFPDDIRAVANSQTTKSFVVELSGKPVTNNDVLVWRVIIPDKLHTAQPATSGPRYAILRPSQQGLTDLAQGFIFVNVTFPTEMPDNDWVFEALEVENLSEDSPMVLNWTVATHTTSGFRLDFQGTPDSPNYKLRWKVA